MARIDLLDPRESDDPELREWAPNVTYGDRVPNHFKAETPFPEVMRGVYEARLAIARHREIGPELFIKIALAVSMANGCTYCVGAFAGMLSQRLGDPEAARAFQRAVADGDLVGREGDLVGFVLDVHDDPHGLTDGRFEHLRSAHDLSDRGFVGLIYAATIVSGYNRLTVALDLEYDHEYPIEWARSAGLEEAVGG